MPYNLTESQKDLVRWMVEENRAENLLDEFRVTWVNSSGFIIDYSGDQPELAKGTLDALDTEGLVISNISYETKISTYGSSKKPKIREGRSSAAEGVGSQPKRSRP